MRFRFRQWVALGVLATALALPAVSVAATGDVDNDTIANASDNCPSTYNIDQRDHDADGVGTVCDPTPGVPFSDSTFFLVYHRDVATGGPLSADLTSDRCATIHWYSDNFDITGCYRQFMNLTLGSSVATFELVTAPPGCTPLWESPFTLGPKTGNGNVEVINLYYLCEADVETSLSQLAAASTGVGPGSSLADKVAAIQDAYAAGDLATACGKLAAFVNQVEAQSGKKISTATAASLIEQAQAIRAAIGC